MATVVQIFLKCACPAEGMGTCRFWRFDAVHMFICRHLCCDLNPSLVKLRKILNSPFIFKCHIMPFFESPSPLVLPSFIYLPMLPSFFQIFSSLLLIFCFFLSCISDPSLSFFLLPRDCSHFLTIPRTSHTHPLNDPQTDPR